jgi:hypothetical protein
MSKKWQVENLIDHLNAFTSHNPWCSYFIKERDDKGRFASYGCNCGLEKARRELESHFAQAHDLSDNLEVPK